MATRCSATLAIALLATAAMHSPAGADVLAAHDRSDAMIGARRAIETAEALRLRKKLHLDGVPFGIGCLGGGNALILRGDGSLVLDGHSSVPVVVFLPNLCH